MAQEIWRVCTDNLNSGVMVMKSAENRACGTAARNRAMDRRILVERPMRPQLVIVSGILRQNPAQMCFAQYDHMVDTLAPDRSDQALGKCRSVVVLLMNATSSASNSKTGPMPTDERFGLNDRDDLQD
jgi:hypothetical protein